MMPLSQHRKSREHAAPRQSPVGLSRGDAGLPFVSRLRSKGGGLLATEVSFWRCTPFILTGMMGALAVAGVSPTVERQSRSRLAGDDLRPSSYAGFVSVLDYPSIEEALQNESYLYFPSTAEEGRAHATYVLDNPIVVDRDEPFVLHGNHQLFLKPRNRDQPLFIVRNTPYFNIERFVIDYDLYAPGGGKPDILNATGILFEHTAGIRADMQLVELRDASLTIRGPGLYVLQRYTSRMRGILHAGIDIDHPEAEVFVLSAGGGNHAEPAALESEDIYWIWCRRGHLEVYSSFPSGFTRGKGDIRIDSPSPRGSHILAFNRSEGTKRRRGGAPEGVLSRMLYVPPSTLPVNVALKANRSAAQEPGSALVDYNAAGTLWLIGNNAPLGAGIGVYPREEQRALLVTGVAPHATIIALGNRVHNVSLLEKFEAGTAILAGNLGILHRLTLEQPADRPTVFFPESGRLDDLPEVPRSNPPTFRSIPVGDSPGAALDLVSVHRFGAAGDGVTDDTESLQAAFDSRDVTRLYFPPGTYVTSRPLNLRISERYRRGGWIAGAGSSKSRIHNRSGGTVINANGLLWTHIQGLAFESVDQSDVCFHLDKVTGHTSGVLFDDCRFIGGSVAMGVAMDSGPNCEYLLFTDCTFEGAGIGYASGNVNAFQNLFVHALFRNNEINFAHRWRDRAGTLLSRHPSLNHGADGSYAVLSAEFIGTRKMDFDFGFHRERFFLNIVSDSPMITDGRSPSRSSDIQIFENCQWNRSEPLVYRRAASGGPIFIHSRTRGPVVEVEPGEGGSGFAINLGSDLGAAPWDNPVQKFE